MTNAEKIRIMTQKPWFYPVALLLIGFITYGYVMPALGYYWDDWEIVMFNKLNPALQFGFYAHDRPFPWTYQMIQYLVGSAPLGWHIVTLIIRWAAVLVFVQALILLWPRYENHLYWLGALLLVYPGFLQQSQSATKARHIMTFLLFALSIYFMILAIRKPKWARIFFPLSWLTAFVQLFTTEYFSGMELIRPVILWMLLAGEQESKTQTLRKVVKYFLPYLGIIAFYFWCRLVYFPQIFHTTSRISEINTTVGDLQTSTGSSFLAILNRALMDFIYLIGQVWINAVIEFEGFTFESKVAWFVFGVGILLTLAFSFFYSTSEKETSGKESPAWIFTLGLIAFLLGAVPVWVIGKDISSGGWADRFALAPLIGACLMVLALLLWFVRPAGQKIILSVLLVFSIAAQMWVVNQYRQDWRTQLDFYWQLYWRAPALEPGTAIISFEQPSPTVTHYADAGYAINVLYHYQTEDGTLPYWMFPRQRHFDYQPNDSFRIGQRQLTFAGNTSKAIAVLHQGPNACLRVLDPIYADDPFLQGRDVLMNVTDPSFIIPDPNAPPPDPQIFGREPAHDWCYYFQKADLARQTGDWKQVIALYKESQDKGLVPSLGTEYIPFIEAYAQTGDWDNASRLTRLAMKTNAGQKKILCNTWSRLSQIPTVDVNAVGQVNQSLACSG